MQHVVILGAGPAGLGAALQLRRRGLANVTVLERGSTVGGLAGSFEVSGMNVDYGSHRLHAECRPDILHDLTDHLAGDLLLRRRRGRIRLEGRWIDFPLRPLNLVKNMPLGVTLGAVRDVAFRSAHRSLVGGESFASVMERGVGSALCDAFYFPYARKVWGLEPEDISSVQASRRVAARSASSLVRKAMSSVPIVGSRSAGSFYYPRGGYGQISQALADAARAAGAQLLLDTDVTEVRVDGTSPVAVAARGASGTAELAADQLWSTIPITALVDRMYPAAPADVSEAGHSLRSRAIVLAYLTLATDQFSTYDTHYFPQENVPFSRVSEPKNFSGEGPTGRTVLCAEIPTEIASEVWNATSADIEEAVLDGLAVAGLPVDATVLDTTIVRLPAAYPIYDKGFESAFETIDRWVGGVSNVVTFGRHGLFAHNNLHHVLEMAYAAVDCLDGEGRFDRNRWNGFRTVFDRQVVVD